MLNVGPREIMHVVFAHTDECPRCSVMDPCEVGQKLVRWSIQTLAALCEPPAPKESKD